MVTEMTEIELQQHLAKVSADMAEMNRVKVDDASLSELTALAKMVVPSDIDETVRILLNSEKFGTLKNPDAVLSMLIQMDETVLTLAEEIVRLRK